MPTTYTHDLFGKKVYQKLPKEMQDVIRHNGNIFRIGLHGPDILFYDLLSAETIDTGVKMHERKARPFFERGMKQARETGNEPMLAYLLGFACHYMLDSKCHPYINELDANQVISHTAVEKELDRYLMLKTGHDPHRYYPAHCIRPKHRYAKVIHKLFPGITTEQIYKSLCSMKFITRLMVYDDKGAKRFLMKIGTKFVGKKRAEMVMDFFMTKNPVRGSQVPVAKLMKLFQEAVEETPAYLEELYQLIEAPYPLSQRWDRTFNG